MSKIKAISLWEPWASLIRTGAKTWETRSWPTKYRGPLLICASKGGLSKYDLLDKIGNDEFQKGLMPLLGYEIDWNCPLGFLGVGPQHLNFGKAVALVEIINCIPTSILRRDDIGKNLPFGDFSPGRYAWKLKMMNNTFEPFPAKGRQGLFWADVSEGIEGIVKGGSNG